MNCNITPVFTGRVIVGFAVSQVPQHHNIWPSAKWVGSTLHKKASFKFKKLLTDPDSFLFKRVAIIFNVVGCLHGEACMVTAEVMQRLVAESTFVSK